jgi:hypothetical protein
MTTPTTDQRGTGRRAIDEQIAAEPRLEPLELAAEAMPSPIESHLGRLNRRLVALVGVVENGLIRLLDPAVKLPEHSRVIIVTFEET